MTGNYSEGLVILLDIHAPTIRSNVIQKPSEPWYTDPIRVAERQRKTLERKERKSRILVHNDKLAYRNQCSVVAKQLRDIKDKYLSDKVDECSGDIKMLHKVTDTFLGNENAQHYG